MKANNSFLKRVRVTRNGKIVTRVAGQNHFNAKASRRTQLTKRRTVLLDMSSRDRRRFLPGM